MGFIVFIDRKGTLKGLLCSVAFLVLLFPLPVLAVGVPPVVRVEALDSSGTVRLKKAQVALVQSFIKLTQDHTLGEIQADPKLRFLYSNLAVRLGQQYAKLKRPDLELLYVQAAVDNDPKFFAWHTFLGSAFFMRRRYLEAQQSLETAKELISKAPGNQPRKLIYQINILQTLGHSLAELKRYKEAETSYLQAIKVMGTGDHTAGQSLGHLYGYMALLYYKWGHETEGRTYLNKAMAFKGDRGGNRIYQGSLLATLGVWSSSVQKNQEAVGYFEQALVLFESEGPNSTPYQRWVEVQINLSELYRRLGKTNKRRAALQGVVNICKQETYQGEERHCRRAKKELR